MSHLGSVGRRALSIGIAAAAAGVTAPALAQTGQPTLSAEGATFGAPIRAVSLDLAGDVIYDSNILGARQGTEGLRGVSKDDIILRPSLEALITLPAGPVQLGLNGSLGYNFHTENKQLDSERIDVNATASVNRGGCGAIVNGGLFRSQNELRDLSIEVGDPEASSVNIQTISKVGGTVYCGQAIGFRALGTVEYRQSRNDNERRRVSNVNNFTYGGGVMYSSPALGQVTAFVGKSRFEYPDRDPVLMMAFPDVNVLSYGGRLDRRLGARLQFHGQVTYTEVDIDGVAGKAFDGINWDIAASLRASDNLQLTVSTARQIDASNGFRSNFAESTIYSAEIAYVITSRLRLRLSGSRQNRDFDTSTIIANPGGIDSDRFTRLSARMLFQRFQRLSFQLYTTYEERKADDPIYDYDGFTVGLGARLRL